MAGLSILGTGRYVPSFALTNQMLETIVETNDEWITSRTGVHSRAIAGADETNLSMSLHAAKKALAQANVRADDIGVIIAATITPDCATPSLACLLQRDLALPQHLLAFDLNAACSGFVYALKTAHALLEGQEDKAALVVGCDVLSKIVDYTDRGTCILFGDGAGAAVIRRTSNGACYFDAGSQGDSEALIARQAYLCNNPFVDRCGDRTVQGVVMNGKEVFRFAVESASSSILKILGDAQVEVAEIDHFVFHQANERIVRSAAKRLGVPMEKCILNIGNIGNTSAASVAIALDELNDTGTLARGDKVVACAFGGGLTFGSIYFTW